MKASFYSLFFIAAIFGVIWSLSLSDGGALLSAANETRNYPEPKLTVDDNPIDRSKGMEPNSYADMLDRVTPSVVGIITTRIVSVAPRSRHPMEEFFRRYGESPDDRGGSRNFPDDEGVEERRIPSGLGSGVIISPEGYILTNNHVITVGRSEEVADEIKVQLADGSAYTAELIGTDRKTDVAVIKIDADEPLSAMTLADSGNLRVGDVCFAIGNPFQVGLTVTKGIISALGRTDLRILGMQGYEDFIQTDASINMGNSGGALVDSNGRLIGINTAILSRTGGNIGIGFAIPVNMARYIMDSLITDGTVSRGYLGVVIGNMNGDLAESFGLENTRGALIRQVEEGGAADQAGIRHGDVILNVDGRDIQSASELRLAIAQTPPGDSVDIRIYRGGELLDLDVILGDLETGMAKIDSGPLGGTERPSHSAIPGLVIRPMNGFPP